MPRDYKNRHVGQTEAKTSPASFLIGLVFGLAVAGAVIFYLDQDEEKEIVNEPAKHVSLPVEEEIIEVETEPETDELLDITAKEPVAEEPVYDFYNILPNMEVNVSEWEETEEQEPIAGEEKPGIYVLQIGSFRKLESADEVKAKLALLGISADIQRVVINGQDIFHRVRIGPYETAEKLEEAKSRLMANNLEFKLLKLTVENL